MILVESYVENIQPKNNTVKNICLYFQVHQPFRYRKYRFFDIGNDSYYYDDYANETFLRRIADNCYLPANKLLLSLIKKHKNTLKISFSLSGIVLEQFMLYAPEVLESFVELANTGCVEFLSETYSHSLVSLKKPELLREQIDRHDKLIEKYFNQQPKIFRNTELIYSDEIGETLYSMGFKGILAEGARHVLGWKSPGFLYNNAINPRMKVLLRNYKLSDDIAFRFSNTAWSEYPLTPEKYIEWIEKTPENDELINLFMDYESLGEHQKSESGIFDFIENFLNSVLKNENICFITPSQAVEKLQPVAIFHAPNPISWADEERDLTAWIGNELQNEALNKLYNLYPRVKHCNDPDILRDWDYLQISDHFYYMCTKFFADGEVHKYFNPYQTAYEAFINYMNVLADFTLRLDRVVPINQYEQKISMLENLLAEKDGKIKQIEAENQKLTKRKKSKKKMF